MSKNRYFKCAHCQKTCKRNPRIKRGQKYCGAGSCQQARKNDWEREKLGNDSVYKERRRDSKRRWYKRKPGYEYQREYRGSHSGYRDSNRQKQVCRNQKGPVTRRKGEIVKTDALISKTLTIKGLYVLLPYTSENIVKTDALIVQMVSPSGFDDVFAFDCKDRHDCKTQTDGLLL